jgi:hypothetical protein
VARVVRDTYRHFDSQPGRDVVPILVQDAARDRVREQCPPRPGPPDAQRGIAAHDPAWWCGSARVGQANADLGDQFQDRRQ